MKGRITLAFCVILLSGCNATTRLSGYVDPDYRGNFQAKKMVIHSAGLPLEEIKAVEDIFVTSFEGYDVEVIRGLDAYPPTRNVQEADRLPIAKKYGADSLLLLYAGGRDVHEEYVPPTFHPGTSTSHISGYGNYATVNTYTTPGYTSGGYSISKPSMAVFVTLFDTKKNKIIWEAEGTSAGNAYASFKDLSMSAARTAVTELFKANLIKKREEEEIKDSADE